MHLPLEVYEWLVSANIIANTGEQDEKGSVILSPAIAANFDSGFLVGEIVRKLASNGGGKVPGALSNVKADSSKNAKLTNWNFIWLAFDSIGLKLQSRIKELILQGERALVVEVIRRLFERDQHRSLGGKVTVRVRSAERKRGGQAQAVDIKKINLSKDPEESQTSLQFLMLLLKASLGMNLQEILGLFTNQNKYLAQIIVKGLNDSFDSIVLFYSLLLKHANKLKTFHQEDPKDAQACLYALKPGFISKSQQVAELTIELFSQLGDIYEWFIGDGKCAGTLLLGLKRHPPLRELYWHLLLQIIQGEEADFFTTHFRNSFQTPLEQIQVTSFLLRFLAQSYIGQKLSTLGAVASWVQSATKLPQDNLQAQLVCFRIVMYYVGFVGELMCYLPAVAEQNEQAAGVFERPWYTRTMPEFAVLLTELMILLQKLGETKSVMAKRVYLALVAVAKGVGAGDKRDFLVENFLSLIPKFPSIPSHLLIAHLRRSPLSSSEYLLVCQSLQAGESMESVVALGNFLKSLFLEDPLLNFNLFALLKEVVSKVTSDKQEDGINFVQKLLEEILALYGGLEVKYRPRGKQQQSIYFGRKGSPEKINKEEEIEEAIKEKWKQVALSLVLTLLDLFLSQENDDLKDLLKTKLLDCNANIRLNNHKVSSKALENILQKKFGISKQEQLEHSQESSMQKASAELDESRLRKSKAAHSAAVMSRLKGPESLTREFQMIAERRKQEEEGRRALQLKLQLVEERKKITVKKEAQLSNLLRGQVGEAQLRELGFLQRLVVEPRGSEVVPGDQLQSRELEAIDALFKNYHKVLRHLFLSYTWTMYNSHSNERFEDNQQRKETLNAVQLGRMLKDYRLAFLTSQPELCSLVRDINVKLLGRREVNELDYAGFEQFVIQFCAIVMPRNHALTTMTPDGASVGAQPSKRQPLHAIVSAFFAHLKNAFLVRGEKVTIFEDNTDIPLSKEQAYEVQIFNKKLQVQPSYILPKGYKKVANHRVDFHHSISSTINGIPQGYMVAAETLDSILAACLQQHFLEDIAVKKTEYRIKPNSVGGFQGFPRERAMSTFLERKQTGEAVIPAGEGGEVRRSSTPRVVALPLQPQEQKPKRSISVAKLQELERARFEALQRRAREKEEERQAELERERSASRRRRVQMEKYYEEVRTRAAEKAKKDAEQRAKRMQEEEEKEAAKKENKEKFKVFHQGQLEKIKKISEEVAERQRREKEDEEEERGRQEELRRRLREKIEVEDKRTVEAQREAEKKVRSLFDSEPIKRIMARFQPNLRALFDFLVQNTFLSLTERRHNNQIVFDTWRYFITAFQLAILVHPRDTALIFKTLTKDKIIPKEYLVGLSFEEFQQALLRIAVKHRVIFNLVADKIKDKQPETEKPAVEAPKEKEKKGKKAKGKGQDKGASKEKEQPNELGSQQDISIKELMKEQTGRDSNDDLDLSNVTDRTLLGLIYYLKVPHTKHGQQKRFRDVLASKQGNFAHNTDRLKQKLNEEYSFEVPQPKPRLTKSPPQSIPPYKLLK